MWSTQCSKARRLLASPFAIDAWSPLHDRPARWPGRAKPETDNQSGRGGADVDAGDNVVGNHEIDDAETEVVVLIDVRQPRWQ
jgi:hypothetical protein